MPQTAMRSIRSSTRLLLALAAVSALAACIEWDRSTSTQITDIRLYVSGVQTQVTGQTAVFRSGSAPVVGVGPVLTAAIPAIVLKGGSALVTFTSPTPFTRLVVAVAGVSGFWDLQLVSPVTSLPVLIVYAQNVGAPAFQLNYAAGTAASIGAYRFSPVAFLGNGTGDVQVNISWNSKADVDLYVVDPIGEEIFYGHRGSGSGGMLDIDSNAGCNTDGPRAENIFWPSGIVPPHGTYTIRANYWSACGETGTDYVVTIRVRGGLPMSYTGHFDGPGVGGASGAGRRVADAVF